MKGRPECESDVQCSVLVTVLCCQCCVDVVTTIQAMKPLSLAVAVCKEQSACRQAQVFNLKDLLNQCQ